MIKELCQKLGFPEDSSAYLESCLAKLMAAENTAALIMSGEESLFEGDFRHDEMLEQVSEASGMNRFTVNLVFVLYCARSLLYVYRARGYCDELFYNTMRDLKYKLMECRTVYGIDGIFPLKWYNRFFLCKLFSLGRLEYGVNEFIYDEWDYGTGVLKKGDLVFDCHIPSSGEPFTPDAVLDSLRMAHKFFKENGELKDDIMTVICHSYLLYPGTLHLFPENGNVRRFANLFDATHPVEEPDNPNFWRIFGKHYNGNAVFENLDLNTSLRRSFASYIAGGGCMGVAYGLMRFDGQNIIYPVKK